jgi:hypothetical protein
MWGTLQTQAEAQSNLDRQVARRIAQLREKAAQGTITAAQAEELRRLTGEVPSDFYTAEDAVDAGWDAFEEESREQIKNLPDNVKSGVGSITRWAGETVGGAGGGLFAGLFKGMANKTTVIVGVVIVAVLAWAFLRGPLKGAKVKFIPI